MGSSQQYGTNEKRRACMVVRELIGDGYSDEFVEHHARMIVDNIRMGQREDAAQDES